MQYLSQRTIALFACAGLVMACGQEDDSAAASVMAEQAEQASSSLTGLAAEESAEIASDAKTAVAETADSRIADSRMSDALAAGGELSDDKTLATIQPPAANSPAGVPAPVAELPTEPLGSFELTYYWMANQSESKARDKRKVQLFSKDCKKLVKVTRSFAKQLDREGTGHLKDGRTINVSGDCKCRRSPCYFVLSEDQRWGVGVGHRPLSPFRSVAVDPAEVPIGTLLYLPELDGLTMPGKAPYGGFVHDGCVVADDRGGAVDGHHVDLFMAKKSHYQAFDRRHRLRHVTVFDGHGRCARDGDKLVPTNRNSI